MQGCSSGYEQPVHQHVSCFLHSDEALHRPQSPAALQVRPLAPATGLSALLPSMPFLFQRNNLSSYRHIIALAVLHHHQRYAQSLSGNISFSQPFLQARTRAARSCAVRRSSATGDLAATVGVSSPVRSGLTTSADAEETRLGATGARFRELQLGRF